ncbi:MAG: 30S ribosomal protein S6 [Bacillaceae bacterium]|nr:30S ribosomal protein S6 [Bacillaceae bacterium]
MREYEVMYILKPTLEEEAIKSQVERYQGVVTDNGGEVTKLDEWGMRRLAYEIDKFREGYYVVMNFKSNSDVVDEMERLMRISDDVIRYMFVKEDE